MNDNGILLGKRHFLYFKEQTVKVEDWTFSLAPGFKTVAGGSANPVQTLISIYRESEKLAQLQLTHRRNQSDLTVQALSSEIFLEINPQANSVQVSLKN